jgi:predicted RNase H-like nuclease
MPAYAVGVDGYPRGWVAISLIEGRFHRAGLFASFSEVIAAFPDAVIAVDIPIGLPHREPRQADLDARRFVGARRNSVFLVPPREVLEAPTFEAAQTRSRDCWGRGISRQAYALRDKIFEVDRLVRPGDQIVEVHPEVSFRALAHAPLRYGKKTWGGLRERMRLLMAGAAPSCEQAALVLPDDLGEVNEAGPDDVVDAAVAAWSGFRRARGQAQSLPENPPQDDRGRLVAIWY